MTDLEAAIDAAVSAAEASYDHGSHYECCYSPAAFAIAVEAGVRAVMPPAPAVTRDELAILAEEVLFEHRERRDGMQPADGNSRCACGHSTGQQPGPGRPGGRRPGHHPMDFHRAQVLADELARYDIRLRPTEGSDTDAH